ncbi:hypothetical protein JEY40_31705 [Bradyrhizobium japonicum]|uniref:hypothetical protein n=1 Tax=Bradyrhizobium japonicum TaxID=375 RepID=UPI00200BCB10|nr:hypothetical protein [Bradyrhizobium japonicum]UQD70490.1 hypothetical protein JEY40_31705 [Bradyrhizobium japonicum]
MVVHQPCLMFRKALFVCVACSAITWSKSAQSQALAPARTNAPIIEISVDEVQGGLRVGTTGTRQISATYLREQVTVATDKDTTTRRDSYTEDVSQTATRNARTNNTVTGDVSWGLGLPQKPGATPPARAGAGLKDAFSVSTTEGNDWKFNFAYSNSWIREQQSSSIETDTQSRKSETTEDQRVRIGENAGFFRIRFRIYNSSEAKVVLKNIRISVLGFGGGGEEMFAQGVLFESPIAVQPVPTVNSSVSASQTPLVIEVPAAGESASYEERLVHVEGISTTEMISASRRFNNIRVTFSGFEVNWNNKQLSWGDLVAAWREDARRLVQLRFIDGVGNHRVHVYEPDGKTEIANIAHQHFKGDALNWWSTCGWHETLHLCGNRSDPGGEQMYAHRQVAGALGLKSIRKGGWILSRTGEMQWNLLVPSYGNRYIKNWLQTPYDSPVAAPGEKYVLQYIDADVIAKGVSVTQKFTFQVSRDAKHQISIKSFGVGYDALPDGEYTDTPAENGGAFCVAEHFFGKQPYSVSANSHVAIRWKAAKINARMDRHRLTLEELLPLTHDDFKTVANLSFPHADFVRYSTVFDQTVTSISVQEGFLGIGRKMKAGDNDTVVAYQKPDRLQAVISSEDNQVELLEASGIAAGVDLCISFRLPYFKGREGYMMENVRGPHPWYYAPVVPSPLVKDVIYTLPFRAFIEIKITHSLFQFMQEHVDLLD